MPEDNNQNQIKTEAPAQTVETYVGDMTDVIGGGEEGLVRKIIHEQEGFELEKKNLSPDSKRNKFFMFSSILLILLALVIFSFFLFKTHNPAVTIAPQFTPLIFTEKSTILDITGLNKDDLEQLVLDEINKTPVKTGSIEGIYLTENQKTVGLRRLVDILAAKFVPGYNTQFVRDDFLMGSFLTGLKPINSSEGDFFMLIKVRSNADIFDALRGWERNMLTDLHGFLGVSISSDTNYLFKKNFEDSLVLNKNARILYDKDGNIVLMYIFANDNSIVITDNMMAAQAIMLRLASSQTGQ